MSKDLYLIWHGATLFMNLNKCEGWSDSILSEQACEQARATGRNYFAARGIRPDAFFSSMSERACDTLELVCEAAFDEPVTYERFKGLKDINFGIYEGKDAVLVPPAPYGNFFVKFDGESIEGAAQRLEATLLELAARPDVHTALVSTHQLACSQMCTHQDGELAQRVSSAPACSVLHLVYDESAQALTPVELYEAEA